MSARSDDGASTLSSPDHAASPPQACGQISPFSSDSACIADGSTPATGSKPPSSDNSPSAIYDCISSCGNTPMPMSSAMAMGRSKWLPSFNISAGARLTMMRFAGSESPSEWIAARTRSFDSPTALSGRPTIANVGRPPTVCTCTSMGVTSIPSNATVLTCATIPSPPFSAVAARFYQAAGRRHWNASH